MYRGSRALLPVAMLFALATSAATAQTPTPTPAMLTVAMHAENGSSLEGLATVTDSGDRKHPAITVTVLYANTMFIPEAQYPTEIRTGRCGDVTAKHAYALNPVQAGRSATTLKNVSLATLSGGPYTIDVHAANAIERYVSCGEIGSATPAPGARATATSTAH